jgi:two-component system chemotaxis sensor kinase CheA
MTRRLPVIRPVVGPEALLAAVVGAFPGAVLLVGASGVVTEAWAGPGAVIRTDHAVGRDIYQLLGLADDAADALALWLACAIGVDLALFEMTLGDPPRRVPATPGRPALALDYGPMFDGAGLTRGVVVFARATSEHAPAPAVTASSPAQVERFLAETQALLDDCAADLGALERDHDARAAVARMFRAIHTLKGAARATGFGPIAALAHQLEDTLEILRRAGHVATGAEIATTRRLLVQLGQQVQRDVPHDAALDAMAALYGAYRPLVARAEAALMAWQTRPRDADLGAAFTRALDQLRDTISPFRLRGPMFQIAAVVDLTAALRAAARPSRGGLAQIDQGMAALHDLFEVYRDVYGEFRAQDRAAEIIHDLARARQGAAAGIEAIAHAHHLVALVGARRRLAGTTALVQLIDDLPRMMAPTPAAVGSRRAIAQAQRVVGAAISATAEVSAEIAATHPAAAARLAAVATSLRVTADRLAWVPLDELFRRVQDQASALATELGKQASVEVEAFAAVVPEPIFQAIADLLIHAIRNAIDHGIEPPADRAARGKRAAGTITVTVEVGDDAVLVAVIDDGAGVDLDAVRRRALHRGLVHDDDVLTEHDLHELVFDPGLSTAARVSDVSGRGVGMDAIRALAEARGGTAALSSERGRGTSLTVRLPLAPAAGEVPISARTPSASA